VFSMFPPLGPDADGRERAGLRKRAGYAVLAERALSDLAPWLAAVGADKLPTARTGGETLEDDPAPAEPTPAMG
ncbi:MAG: hypothetical protein ACK5U8_06260, partial [Deltaproteobacteria bacterium]